MSTRPPSPPSAQRGASLTWAVSHRGDAPHAGMAACLPPTPDHAPPEHERPAPAWLFAAAIVCVGCIAGTGGTLLALLLHLVQHVAYGYDLGHVGTPENFLQGVTSAPPWRRVVALSSCGVVAGIGWWAVYRFGRPLVSIQTSVGRKRLGPPMPPLTTLAHTLLQIITVALGSPLGREVAPRELGAMLATRLSHRMALSPEQTRIAVACGAGAGLAAVYNVPLGGALFTLEVLLATAGSRAILAALASSVIASTLAWTGLGDVHQYTIAPLVLSLPLAIGALLLGPVCGVAAFAFRSLRSRMTQRVPQGWRRITWSLAVFTALGLIAMLFPQLPGNGRGPSQLGIGGDLGLRLAASLLLLKIFAVAASLRTGAAGGVLTPSFTIGALLATVLAYAWNLVLPGVPTAGFAVIGAAAFLASSLSMPLTAVMLTIEFTQVGYDLWMVLIVAVAGSSATCRLCQHLTRPTTSQAPSASNLETSHDPRSR